MEKGRREEGRKRKPRGPAALGQAVGKNSVGYSWSILNTSQYLVHADDLSVKVVDWWSKRTCIVKACCVYRVRHAVRLCKIFINKEPMG